MIFGFLFYKIMAYKRTLKITDSLKNELEVSGNKDHKIDLILNGQVVFTLLDIVDANELLDELSNLIDNNYHF